MPVCKLLRAWVDDPPPTTTNPMGIDRLRPTFSTFRAQKVGSLRLWSFQGFFCLKPYWDVHGTEDQWIISPLYK